MLTFDHAPVSSFTLPECYGYNPMHSGWQFMRALYDSYGIPLATFEV